MAIVQLQRSESVAECPWFLDVMKAQEDIGNELCEERSRSLHAR